MNQDEGKVIPWNNVISCLLDNCNTMRGKNGGLETLIHGQNNNINNMLDVHGDTVHIVANIVKQFCSPFKNFLEDFSNDLYYDFKLSPKAKDLFTEVCNLLGVSGAVSFLRPVGSRFVQMFTVSERIHQLWEPSVVFFYGFLTQAEKKDAV